MCENNNNSPGMQYMPLGMCVGVSIGMALGVAMKNIAVGMCTGLSVGMCIGAAIDSMNRKKKTDIPEPCETEQDDEDEK